MAIQTFDPPGGPAFGRRNLPRLRAALTKLGLDGFIVPHEDEYQNEYVPEALDRLAWVSGFTGSAGAAIVMRDRAAIFVDGRYRLQVKAQVDHALFAYEDLVALGLPGWLRREAPAGAAIGYDPRLHAPDALERLKEAAGAVGAKLVATLPNPIDQAWGKDRPPIPAAPVTPYPEELAGESARAKRVRLGEALAADRLDAALITSPASIAWLFNIRGSDVARAPLPLGAAILDADGSATLFLAKQKHTRALQDWLGADVRLAEEESLAQELSGRRGQTLRVDPTTASAWTFELLAGSGIVAARGPDPVALPRATKNPIEVENARRAHIRDGAALTRFLHWLATEGQTGKVDEIEACRRLEAFRAELPELKDLSFDTISGAGPNGALPHYRVDRSTNRRLKRGSFFLVDSGGQYLDGTTDVTRTVAIGRPSAEMKDRFTRVLQGHIALARIIFPEGTTGSALDAVARLALWDAGLDYDHGTGHGVGAYLSVHEGPHRISKSPNSVPLQTGMIVSNEPGYYKEGAYGIRIENLQVVTPLRPIAGGEREMMGFETLTLAPIDRSSINRKLLTQTEKAWLNQYHARVCETIGPQLDPAARSWLEEATAPI